MDTVYANIVRLKPPRIAGKRLVPFALGHALILESFGSPLVTGLAPQHGQGGVYEHLLFALWVCSRPYSQALDGLQSAASVQFLRGMVWWWRMLPRNPATAYKAFALYLEEYTRDVRLWIPTDGTVQPSTVPWVFRVFWRLHRGLDGASWDFIWNLPVTTAFVLCACAADDEGIKTRTEAEDALIESLPDVSHQDP